MAILRTVVPAESPPIKTLVMRRAQPPCVHAALTARLILCSRSQRVVGARDVALRDLALRVETASAATALGGVGARRGTGLEIGLCLVAHVVPRKL